MARILGSVALVFAIVLSSNEASASGDRILLVLEPGSETFALRMRSELEALGFSVTSEAASENAAAPVEILQSARRARAAAAVRIRVQPQGTEIWLVDRVTGKTVLREVPGAAARDDALLVTKTTELLRASLLELEQPGFQPAEVPPTEAIEHFVPQPARGSLRLGLGAAKLSDFSGLNGSLDAVAGWASGAHSNLGIALQLPLTRPSVARNEGRATLALSSLTLRAELTSNRRAPLGVTLGLAGGAAWLHVSADAQTPYRSQNSELLSGSFSLYAGPRVRLAPRAWLRLEAAFNAFVPQPRVLFADRVVARVREPTPSVSALVELSL